jgi:hypothetical protein
MRNARKKIELDHKVEEGTESKERVEIEVKDTVMTVD